jgi:hypothetical protein
MEKEWERRGARDIGRGRGRRRERAGVATTVEVEVAAVGMRCKEDGAALESRGRAAVPTRNNSPTWSGHHKKNLIFFLSAIHVRSTLILCKCCSFFYIYLQFDASCIQHDETPGIIEVNTVIFNSNSRCPLVFIAIQMLYYIFASRVEYKYNYSRLKYKTESVRQIFYRFVEQTYLDT